MMNVLELLALFQRLCYSIAVPAFSLTPGYAMLLQIVQPANIYIIIL